MRLIGVLVFFVFLLIPFVGLSQYYLYIANLMLIYIILALGLNLLIGYAGQLAFANAAMFGIGAYGVGLLQKHFGIPYLVGAPFGALLAMAIGTVLVVPALRLSGIYLALVTIAFAQCTLWVMNHWLSVTFGASGFTIPAVSFSPLPLSSELGIYYLSWLCCVLLVLFAKSIVQSRIGRAFVALRDHEFAAQALGINLFRYKALAFALSGFYAGVAGVLFAGLLSFVGPESFGLHQMVLQLAAVLIGGTASIAGSVLGGILIVGIEEVVREFKFSIEIAFGGLLMVFVLFKPTGLIDVFHLVVPRWREPLSGAADLKSTNETEAAPQGSPL